MGQNLTVGGIHYTGVFTASPALLESPAPSCQTLRMKLVKKLVIACRPSVSFVRRKSRLLT